MASSQHNARQSSPRMVGGAAQGTAGPQLQGTAGPQLQLLAATPHHLPRPLYGCPAA